MRGFFSSVFSPIKQNKTAFILILLLTLSAIVLGVLASVNFGGGIISINLNNISYIKFLKGNIGVVALIFSTTFTVLVFVGLIVLCCTKKWLIPLAFVIFLYLVYSQTVVFASLILIYGFLNVLLLSIFLLIYFVVVGFLLILILLELISGNHFCKCGKIDFKNKILLYFALIVLITILFAFLLSIMKSFMIILVF